MKKIISYYILPIIIICLICSIWMKYNISVKIIGDEFGYWTSAGWLAGIDWSNTAKLDAYYSFGYGFLLYIIMILPISSVLKYKLGILINIVLICLSYIILYKIACKLNYKKDTYINSIIALISTIYIDNIFYTQFTLTETYLLFIYLLIIYLFMKEIEKVNGYITVCISFLLLYSFYVHQRTIGLTVVGLGLIIYYFFKNKNFKQMVILLTATCSFFILFYLIKKYYKYDFLYGSNVGTLSSSNDFLGQISKIEKLFTIEGLKNFFIGILGKVYYIIISSLGLTIVGVYKICNDIYIKIKNKKKLEYEYIGIFVLLSHISLIIINCIFMIDYNKRYDLLIYGRYVSISNTILILIGIIFLIDINEKLLSKVYAYLSVIIVFIVSSLVVNIFIPCIDGTGNGWIHAPSAIFFIKLFNKKYLLIFILVSILISVLYFIFLSNKEKKLRWFICLAIIGIIWICQYAFMYKKCCISWEYGTNSKCIKMANYINENLEGNIYYLYKGRSTINFLVFVLGDTPIYIIQDDKDMYELNDTDYIVADNNTEVNSYMEEKGWIKICDYDLACLWKHK